MKPEDIGPLLKDLFPPFTPDERKRMLAEIRTRLADRDAELERQEEQRRQEELRREAEAAASRRRRRLALGLVLLLLLGVALWLALRGGLNKPVDTPPEGPPLLVGEEEEEPAR